MAANAVIGALRVILGADTAALEKGLKQAQSSLDKFGENVARTGLAMGAALATALAGVGLAVKGAINEADKLGKMAQSVGVPVEELSRLKHAADLSGVSIESLGKGFGRLSKNMMEAATDAKGTAAQAFAAIGVSVKNADGTLKSSSQIMTELAGKFAVMKDGAGKTALAMALFGRAGAELIPMLNLGKQGLAEMLAEADELGIVIDSKTARAAEAFNDNLTRMSKITSGIVMKVTAEMLPAFLQFSQVLLETAKNQDMMKAAAEGLTSFLRGAVEVVLTVVVVFKRLGAEIAAVWQMLSLFGQGEFTKGLAAYEQAGKDTLASVVNLSGFIKKFYQDAEATAAAQAPKIEQTMAAPFIKAAKISKDALDKFLESQSKKQASMQADLQTIGLSEGAHQRLKTVLEAEAIAKANNITITDQLRQKINDSATSTGMLADALEQTKERWSEFRGAVLQVRSSLENAFVDAIMQAKSFKDIIRSLISDLARMAAQQAFRSMFGGQLAWSNAAGSAFNGGGGILGGIGKLFGFAQGGSFQVGGSGGIDSQLVAFKASPNERVSITKPGQDMGGGITIHQTIAPVFHPGMTPTDMASIRSMMSTVSEQTKADTINLIRGTMARDSRAFAL
jgi:hypothetical protein